MLLAHCCRYPIGQRGARLPTVQRCYLLILKHFSLKSLAMPWTDVPALLVALWRIRMRNGGSSRYRPESCQSASGPIAVVPGLGTE